jgi:uncharacterized protein (DUF2236 family)
MINVVQLAFAFNKEPEPNHFQIMKDELLVRDVVKQPHQMNPKEQAIFNQMRLKFRDSFKQQKVWAEAIKNILSYSRPHFTFLTSLQGVNPMNLFVGANFISSGRQDFMVQYNNEYYFHQTIAGLRTEKLVIPSLANYAKGKRERNPEVFKSWQ